jgi:N utilization substance protein A
MKSEIAEAFLQISKEKNIDKAQLSEILQSIVLNMIKKKYGTADNFEIFINVDKGEIEIYQNKNVVDVVTDPNTQIDLESARKVEPDLEVGDAFLEIVNPESFGRRLIITAKQNLNQRIKDEEKRLLLEEYQNRIGEIVLGDIRQINRNEIYLNVDRTEVVMPKKEQIESEKYRRGDNVRGIIKEVVRTNRGPEIVVSRADPTFLIRLFELEVPEIYDGIIEIKAVTRQPGERAKIAVYSNDKRIDAVGACVGMKGIRIQSVSRELNNEKIDVIPWSSEPEVFITRALSPSKPVRVLVDGPNKRAIAILPDDQVSLGIGRGGQNRRLSSKLTGHEIEIVKESDYRRMIEEQREKEVPLEQVEGLTDGVVEKLKAAGIHTIKDITDRGPDGIVAIKGIGEKTAEKILSVVRELGESHSSAKAEEKAEMESGDREGGKVETAEQQAEDAVDGENGAQAEEEILESEETSATDEDSTKQGD